MLSAIQDFVVSIGTEILKENGKIKYNEQKVQQKLKEYIDREYGIFENIDMNGEIDFQYLQIYITQNLLDDFKLCLLGESKDRERTKNSIIESLYNCTNANSTEKKQYVNNIFDIASKLIKNFYETEVLTTEDLYKVNKITSDISKEIQAGVDKIINNQIAPQNTSESNANNRQNNNLHHGSTDMIHKAVRDKYLKTRYIRNKSNIDYHEYSDLFKMFVQVTDENMEEINVDNLFEFVKEQVKCITNENFIKISGPDGTGKSTFLSLLYMYLFERYCEGDLLIYPFYINLHYYDRVVVDESGQLKKEDEVKQMLITDLKTLTNSDNGFDNGILIIIDGNESYFRTTLKTGRILKSVVDELTEHKKIICIGEKTNVHTYKQRREVMYLDGPTKYNFIFKNICVDDPKYRNFVTYYFKTINNSVNPNKIINKIDKFKLREIDYNLLTILNECYKEGNIENINTINDLYRKYCALYFLGDYKKIELCTELAYSYFMTREEIDQDIISKNWREWELIHQHKTFSNYFLASYFAKLILEFDESKIKQLECVLNNGINIFLKSIINENIENQKKVIANCKKLYEKGTYLAKSQAVYLLGRISSRDLCDGIINYLEPEYNKLLSELNKNRKMENDRIFLFRTMSISLFYLGKKDYIGKNLLEKMLVNNKVNEINRAFFLQYYDDVRYELEQINFTDNGQAPITCTYNILLNQIWYQLNKRKHLWSAKEQYDFQINLFTLCSLVQVRLDKQLESGYISETKKIIEQALLCEKWGLLFNMKTYLTMLKEDIDKEEYNIRHLYNELYSAKDIIRSGWIDKIVEGSVEVDRYENIVEHMYYTWLLGMLYLPDDVQTDDRQYQFYNKNKILSCILIHDLAETYVGDKRPEESTDEHKIAENECMHKIFMHDTYNDIYSMNNYRRVWGGFGLDSRDINGRIAKELDIIQSIYQFYVYKQKGAKFDEKKEKEWREEKRKIKTSIGQKILEEVVLKTFENSSE